MTPGLNKPSKLRTKFYYLRSAEGKPVVTVCLARRGSDTARGVAFCAPVDIPCKATGRAIAQGRAVKALEHRYSSMIARRRRVDYLTFAQRIVADVPLVVYVVKSRYRPTPVSKLEERLLAQLRDESIRDEFCGWQMGALGA